MSATPKTQTPSTASLGLAFLLTGLGFALPILLFPGLEYASELNRAPEVLNLFCLVSWMGLGHFVFAYKGHTTFAVKNRALGMKYLLILITSIAFLFFLRFRIGYAFFSALAWIYFISHLLKAEMYFSKIKDFSFFTFPLLAFTYFSFAMLAPENWIDPWTLWIGAGACFTPFLFKSNQRKIKEDFSKPLALIAAFLIAEALIWGKYRPNMTLGFRDGVYTVHVALASFYHYFKSYAHMINRGQGGYLAIVAVNFLMICLGFITLFQLRQTPMIYVFGVQYFTVWVWLHQWMSDCFNFLKRNCEGREHL